MVSLGLLAVLGWAVGREDSHPEEIEEAILAGATTPGPAVAIAFLAVILAALCIRNVWLNWLAWWPGPIQVELSIPKDLEAEAQALRQGFSSRISTLRLQAPSAVPGAASEGDFLDTLGKRGLDGGNLANSVVTLLRTAFPSHGYRIQGDVARRPEPEGHTITVRVTRLPGEGYPPIECRGASWDAVIRKAADEATAYILPQTRRCREPWRAWRGYVMPAPLLHAYEEGMRHEQARRYDEALARYYAALESDPLNMAIRLQLGKLQEKMGLYIDALATYQAMCRVDGSDERRPYKRTYTRTARAERSRALLAARYRSAVLLGGSDLADQWCKGARPDGSGLRRYEQRTRLRTRLVPEMRDEIARLGTRVDAVWFHQRKRADRIGARKAPPNCPLALTTAISELEAKGLDADLCLNHVNDGPDPDARERELRQLFAMVALRRSAGLWATVPRWSRGQTLSRTTIELTALCIRERLSWLQDREQWVLDNSQLENQIEAIERRWLVRSRPKGPGFRYWHEHYNAACALALPLVPRGREDHQLAKAAIDRLARATTRADSAYLAGRRDWLVSEDPDLDGLRRTPQFKCFEAEYFPTPAATPQRKGPVRHLENARYVIALLSETADRWEAVWVRRAETGDAPAWTTVDGWFRDERDAWSLVQELACEYTDTRTRLDFRDRMRAYGDRYGFTAITVGVPRYEQGPVPLKPGVEAVIAWCDSRMEDVARVGGQAASVSEAGRAGRAGELAGTRRLAYGGPLMRLCMLHAGAWRLLGEWLEVPAPKTERSDRAREALVDALRSLEAFDPRQDLAEAVSATAPVPAIGNGGRRFARRRRPTWLAR